MLCLLFVHELRSLLSIQLNLFARAIWKTGQEMRK
jgi:hypothetical protein